MVNSTIAIVIKTNADVYNELAKARLMLNAPKISFNAMDIENRVIKANPIHSADLNKYTSSYHKEYYKCSNSHSKYSIP